MNCHERKQSALRFAAHKHAGQVRKGTDISYLVHPVSVALILEGMRVNQEVVIAGFLHDTIEDTDATYEEIKELFGERVADTVLAVTESDKKNALKKASEYHMDAVFVKSADLSSNVGDICRDFELHGDDAFKKFKFSKKETLAHYIKLAKLLSERCKFATNMKTLNIQTLHKLKGIV